MRLTIANTFDDNTGELKGTQYFIDGKFATEEKYLDAMVNTEFADELEDEYCEDCGLLIEDCDCDCEEYEEKDDFEDEDEDEDDISEIIDDYFDRLYNSCGSEDCVGDILVDLYNLAFEDGMNTAKLDMIDSISESFED